MKSFRILLSSLVFIFALGAQAALLTTEGAGEKIEKAQMAKAATATLQDQKIALTAAGAGLRSKKVVFVNVKVYAGQLFVSDIGQFKYSESEALASLKNQKAVAIQMHFLRSVDADNVQKSFKEALKANGVNPDNTEVKQFLDAVAQGGEAAEGKTLTVLGASLKEGSETIAYETTSGKVTEIAGRPGLIQDIFSIWLGKPADDGVAALKKSITQLK
jgi:hypothetical protein